MSFTRRKLLKESIRWGGVGAATLAIGPHRALGGGADPRFLLNVCGLGGYSIQDAFMAVRTSEAGARAPYINTFPDAWVESVGPFTAVSIPPDDVAGFGHESFQPEFVRRHGGQMLVYTHRASSVNHPVAQQRVLNGDRAWLGRTIPEAVAAHHGADFPLANVNMAMSGFAEHGSDPSLPRWAKAISVTDPWMFPLALSGHLGLSRPWGVAEVERMRSARSRIVEAHSDLLRTNIDDPMWTAWRENRDRVQMLEGASAIEKLNLNPSTDERPFDEYGLPTSSDLPRLQAVFPRLAEDPFEAQAALAFLLFKHRFSVCVTISPAPQQLRIGPEIVNAGSAFDAAHGIHRPNQALMWTRILKVADRLIELLKSEPYDQTGETLWDRTVLFMPTEFGRGQYRPEDAALFGTAHDLEGAQVIVSPLANGGTVLGEVDRSTGRLRGFDPESPTNLVDPSRTGIDEKETYAGVLHLLDVPTPGSGLADIRALRG